MSQATNNITSARCAWCSGSGKWRVAAGNFTSCAVCGGKGQVLIPPTANACRQCRGSGRRNPINPCLACAGTGWENSSAQ